MDNQKIDVPSFIAELDAVLKRLSAGEFSAQIRMRVDGPVEVSPVGVRTPLIAALLLTDLPYRTVARIADDAPATAAGIADGLKKGVEWIAYGDASAGADDWARNKLLHGTLAHLGATYVRQFTQAFANEFMNEPGLRAEPDDDGRPRGYVLPCSSASEGITVVGMSLQLADHFTSPEKAMAIVRFFADLADPGDNRLGPAMVTFLWLASLRSELTVEEFTNLLVLTKDLHARP